MGLLEKIVYYTTHYGPQLAMSLPYFAVVSFTGLLLVLRRASLFGLVLSASSQLAFVVGMALHLVSYEGTNSLVLMQNPELVVADLLHMDVYLFPLLACMMLPLIIFMSRGLINTESVLAILFVFVMGLIPLVNKLSGGNDLLLLKAYFTEILYTPKQVFSHYLLHLAVMATALSIFFKKFLITGFDPIQARLSGVPLEPVNMLLYFFAGFVIALCVRVLGVYVTMIALLAPGAIALSIFRNMRSVIVSTIAFSVFFALMGFGISFSFDSLPAEPTIIVVFGIASLFVWGGKKIFFAIRRG